MNDKIEDLKDLKQEILVEIAELQEAIEDTTQLAALTEDLDNPIEANDYDGLTEIAEEQKEAEDEDEAEYQAQNWEWWANNTSKEISDTIVDEYDELVGTLESYQDYEETETTSEVETEEEVEETVFLSFLKNN